MVSTALGAAPRNADGCGVARTRAVETACYEFNPAGLSEETEVLLHGSGFEAEHGRFAMLVWLNLVVPDVSQKLFLGEPWFSNSGRSLLVVAYNAADGNINAPGSACSQPAASAAGTASPPSPHLKIPTTVHPV